MITLILFSGFKQIFGRYITWVMILHGIEYQRPTSLNMRIMADHVTYSFLAFMKSIFHFCLGCYCGGYSQNRRSNLSSWYLYIQILLHIPEYHDVIFSPDDHEVSKLTHWLMMAQNGRHFDDIIFKFISIRQQAITWTNDGYFTDTYTHHSASMSW